MLQTRSCRHGGTRACHPAVGGITQGRGAHYKRFTSGSLFAGPANSSLRRHQPGPPPAVHCRHRRRRGAARDSRTVLLFTATRWTNIYFAGFSDPIVRPGCTRAAVAHSGTARPPALESGAVLFCVRLVVLGPGEDLLVLLRGRVPAAVTLHAAQLQRAEGVRVLAQRGQRGLQRALERFRRARRERPARARACRAPGGTMLSLNLARSFSCRHCDELKTRHSGVRQHGGPGSQRTAAQGVRPFMDRGPAVR